MVSKVKKVNPTATKKVAKSSGSEWRIPGPDEFNEPSNNFFDYYTLIHGTAGVGKSSLVASIPGSVIFQFEPARRNIKARQIDFKVSTVAEMERGSENGWKKFTTLLEQVEDDDTVKVIGIDNINEAYKACENDYLLQNGMESVPKKDYGASRGEINREFERVLNNLKFNSRLGVIFTSHTKEREGELNTGTTESMYSPACTAAVFEYLKKAMDFAFFLGYHNKTRAIHCRWDTIWTKCGVRNRFCNLKGQPLNAFSLPDDPSKGYETLARAWENKIKSGIIVDSNEVEE
jgi:hypothetical protein